MEDPQLPDPYAELANNLWSSLVFSYQPYRSKKKQTA